MNARITYLDRRIEELDRQRRELEDEIAKLVEFGDDVYPDDSVILFRKRFGSPRRDHKTRELSSSFTYVALKVAGSWWLTGSSNGPGRRYSWEQLVRFLSEGVTELWEVSEWKRID
jgi:hypothetical protein